MRLLSELAKAVAAAAGTGVQYTVFDGCGGYFQNVKRISEFSSETLVLRGGKISLRIVGKDLSIRKYAGGDVAVAGEIFSVGREPENA